MPTSRHRAAIGCLLAILSLPVAGEDASGPEMGRDKIEVLEAYIAVAPGKARSAELYASFVNVETNDRLAGADSPACERVELVDGNGQVLPFGDFTLVEDVETGLPPRGTHLRLVGLRKPPVTGEQLLVTLHFETGGRLPLRAVVR